jgi:lysozyme
VASVDRKVIAAGVAAALAIAAPLVAKWEGVRYAPYPDPATGGAPWTVCYGSTRNVVPGRTYSKAECDERLREDMLEADGIVRKCIPVPMLPHVEAALISAVFNIGPAVVCGSTLQKMALANNGPAACAQLDRWKYAAGRAMRGLELRRADERLLCETGSRG